MLKRQVAAKTAAGTADSSRRLAISLLSMTNYQTALLTLAAEVVFYGLLGATTFPAAMEQQGLMLRVSSCVLLLDCSLASRLHLQSCGHHAACRALMSLRLFTCSSST